MQETASLKSAHGLRAMSTLTHCPYCAFQCGMRLLGPREQATVTGDETFPVNKGRLCIKGWTAPATLSHPERLLTPLARDASGKLVPVTWDEALMRVVRAFRDTQMRYGRDAVGIFGGGSLTNEKAYLLGKFARVALGTSRIDYNGRFCMSSAAAATLKAFGIDRGLPFPLEDIPQAEVIMLVGGNLAETMPPMMQYFEAQRLNGGQLIVVDPRASATAQAATLHLRLTPGSDAALAHGLLHILVRDGLIDRDYIYERAEGFDQVKAMVAAYWPERVERITGVPATQLEQAARMLGTAKSAMILTSRGVEQQRQGVNNVLACINIALALGQVGHPFGGYGCITGQGNGQGGREHGLKADQLPGYRSINDPAARRHIAHIWGIPESELPGPGKSAYEMLERMGVHFHLAKQTSRVLGNDHVTGLAFKEGSTLDCDMVVISAGIRPNVGLAKQAGLTVERGIVVNDDLSCSGDPAVYAIGECAQHRGRVYGLVAPVWEQAQVLADRLACRNCQAVYQGSQVGTKLKVMGVELTVMGEKETDRENDEVVTYAEPSRGVYKKLIVRNGFLAGLFCSVMA